MWWRKIFPSSLFTFHFFFVPLNYVRKFSRSKKLKFIWFFPRLFVPLQPIIKGCCLLVAEMIPSEPDTDNADTGMMSN